MSGRVTGKLAMVTGAAQGIGAEIAKTLAREGARLILTDINLPRLAETADSINACYGTGTAFSVRHDVTCETDWIATVDLASNTLGGLSVLVNNAGIVVMGSVEDLSLADWRRGISTNLDSVFLGIKHALPLMRKSQPGSIINISSIAGLIAAHNFANYNASKSAVWMLSKSVALHCAKEGLDIRCNSIHPAFVDTPILDSLIGHRDRETMRARLTRQIPLGRLGEPSDVAQAVLYLAADESRFMTGAELKLDGGVSAM